MTPCPVCASLLSAPEYHCAQCSFQPALRGGFLAWAPQLSDQNDGFRREDFSMLAPIEAQHFWFRARNDLIIWALRKYVPALGSLLEIGCGTGFVLAEVARAFPGARLVGTEIFVEALGYAAGRVPRAQLMQMDARALPFVAEFDVATAFDVIEHVEEDELVLCGLHRAIKPQGICVISVPQHMWLWSPVDEEACHKRRYGVGDLERKAAAAGFRIVRSTSFVTLLLPIVLVSRFLDRRKGKSGGPDSLRINPVLNRTLEAALALERVGIRAGVSWPLGSSRLLVLQKI